jgi:tetratricopeptide (TPR) repeat protein
MPCLSLSYLWDDYPFLQRAADFNLQQLIPDPNEAFYRPISRELYFAFLRLLSHTNPFWGHLINALLLATTVALVTAFASRVGGRMLGMLSGLFLATLGASPCLVAWVSCSQDLFAMAFLAAALNLELVGQRALAIVCVVLAVLSKESAFFFLPGLVSLRFLSTRRRRDLRNAAVGYAAIVVVWGFMHAKIRGFLLHGLSTGTGGYVGTDNPFLLQNALRTAGTLVNLPPTGWSTPWPSELTIGMMAGLILVGMLFKLSPREPPDTAPEWPEGRVLWIGILIGILPATLTFTLAKHWFPYYASMPAIGTSILLALLVRRLPSNAHLVLVGSFLVLGIWYRGTTVGKISMPAEANFRASSKRLQTIERELRTLHPEFPESARIYLNVQMPLEAEVHMQLMQDHALRTWYDNHSLVALPVEYQDKSSWPTYLFVITSECNVFEITLPGLRVRSPGPKPDYLAYQKALRSYAMGAWASGDTDRAIAVLLNMQESDQLSWDFDRRMTCALLFASGRDTEANRLLASLPKVPREQAIDGVRAILSPELPRPGLDDGAFQAFGLDRSDAEAYRDLMLSFSDMVKLEKAKRMAERLLELKPEDPDALAMLEAIRNAPSWEPVVVLPKEWTPIFQRVY